MTDWFLVAQLAVALFSGISIIALVYFNWHHISELRANRLSQHLPKLKANIEIETPEDDDVSIKLIVTNIGNGAALNASIYAMSLTEEDLKQISEHYGRDLKDEYYLNCFDFDRSKGEDFLKDFKPKDVEYIIKKTGYGLIMPGDIGYKAAWYPEHDPKGFLIFSDYFDIYDKRHESWEVLIIPTPEYENYDLYKFYPAISRLINKY